MKWLGAIAVAVVGLALAVVAWSTWERAVTVAPVTIAWSDTPPETTFGHNEFNVGSISFVDARMGTHEFVMMTRGGSVAVFHDLEHFLYVDVMNPRVWVLAEGRDAFTLFRSADGGETWDASRIAKPSAQTYVERWEVDGDTVSIHCANDRKPHPDDMEPWEPLVLAMPSWLRPVEYANDLVFRTRDAGRSWHVSR